MTRHVVHLWAADVLINSLLHPCCWLAKPATRNVQSIKAYTALHPPGTEVLTIVSRQIATFHGLKLVPPSFPQVADASARYAGKAAAGGSSPPLCSVDKPDARPYALFFRGPLLPLAGFADRLLLCFTGALSASAFLPSCADCDSAFPRASTASKLQLDFSKCSGQQA